MTHPPEKSPFHDAAFVRGASAKPVEHFPMDEPLPFDLPWEVGTC
jgi:hypothetical protein